MFPGTRFNPPHHYYEVGATTPPESSSGTGSVVNYGASSPIPAGITKLHWRQDYATGGSWTETSHPGYEKPDGYGVDGYGGWAQNCLTNKLAKDLGLGDGIALWMDPAATYVIKIPQDVAMGCKGLTYYNNYWTGIMAVQIGNFPPGSIVNILNHGIIAGPGGTGGRGGGVYVWNTLGNDALGGGGGGGAGLHDWELPFDSHENGDNYGPYPLDADKEGNGPLPDICFPGSGGSPSLQISTWLAGSSITANGAGGPGNVVSDAAASGGVAHTTPTGITQAGTPAVAAMAATSGSAGGGVLESTGVNQTYLIYNYSTGKIISGGGGGGGGAGSANDGKAGADGGAPGKGGATAASTGVATGGSGASPGVVFAHSGFWDPVGATRSKFIIKLNDGVIRGSDGDSALDSAFDVGTEH